MVDCPIWLGAIEQNQTVELLATIQAGLNHCKIHRSFISLPLVPPENFTKILNSFRNTTDTSPVPINAEP